MHKCLYTDISAILTLLRKDIPNCFYMYVDIAKYTLEHPHMEVWVDIQDNSPVSVVMKYFNSMQVYALPHANLESIAECIMREQVPIITGTAETFEHLLPFLGGKYELSYGWVFEVTKFRLTPCPDPIVPAREEELTECAALICEDEVIGGHYTCESLAQQLLERMRDGMGRNYVIHKNGRIIAHIATYAEFENLAVSSGLIVDPAYRDVPYGTYLESYLFNQLLIEGKRVFSFIRSPKRVKFYNALGVTKSWRNGKLLLKKQ